MNRLICNISPRYLEFSSSQLLCASDCNLCASNSMLSIATNSARRAFVIQPLRNVVTRPSRRYSSRVEEAGLRKAPQRDTELDVCCFSPLLDLLLLQSW